MTRQPSERAQAGLFRPVKPERAVDAVIEQILDLIQSGHLRAQELLPGERRLATAMAVSRRTIRDALEVLQDAGVLSVEVGSGGGPRVVSIWIPESLSDQGARGVEEIFGALEARRVVEPIVVQLAAQRRTAADLEAIRETIPLQMANQQDWWLVTQGNLLFHRLIWRAARNAELESAMRSIYAKLGGPLYDIVRHDQDLRATAESTDLHLETLEAIRRGRMDEIDEVMDRHLRYLEDRCEAAYGLPRIEANRLRAGRRDPGAGVSARPAAGAPPVTRRRQARGEPT